jgi:hypothetical protein
MDEAAKAKLRNRARILHWVTELILSAFLLLGILTTSVWPKYTKAMADLFLDEELYDAASLVMAEFGRFYFGRGEQLLAYPPPENCAERDVWAKKIAEDFRQPVAVFVRDCCGLEWITCPPEFAPGQAHIERYFAGTADKKDQVTRYDIGMMETRRLVFGSDSLGFRADIVGPLNDSLRWGIVRCYLDTWRAFLTSLNDPQTIVGPSHPAHMLQHVVMLPSDLTQRLPKFRASIDGNVIFASPKLDTTRHKYISEVEHLRQEYYGTKSRGEYAFLISRRLVSWRSFFLPLFLMLAVHLYWLWIKKLTKPGETT